MAATFAAGQTGRSASAPRPRRPAEPAARGEHLPELRLYGLNAVRAAFARRPQALRKLYLAERRMGELKPLLAWCVKQRVGYRVVGEEDLRKLAGSGSQPSPARSATWC